MTPLPPKLDDAAILAARGARAVVYPGDPHARIVESEPVAGGSVEQVATLFVTGAECAFHCLVCDLWKHTLERGRRLPSVAGQVERALGEIPDIAHVKIYNSGSFFDSQAVSAQDRTRIAELVRGRRRLIVECHPRLVDRRCAEFAAAIAPVELEVAMGLETVDSLALSRLNKGMSLADFDRAARLLDDFGVALRAFVLLGLPGHFAAASVEWAERSVEHALSLGASYTVVIPVRPGNGTVDRLEREGCYIQPRAADLERALSHALSRASTASKAEGGHCVLADLWDIERFFDCPDCGPRRADSMRRMNLTQHPLAAVDCCCQQPTR